MTATPSRRKCQPDPVDPACLRVLRAEHCHQTEEHEDRDLAQPQVPVRFDPPV